MTERIIISNPDGQLLGVVHTHDSRRIGYTVNSVTTQINGGGRDVGPNPETGVKGVDEYDSLGRKLPYPVALADRRRWQELQALRTPGDIEAIKNLPLRP